MTIQEVYDKFWRNWSLAMRELNMSANAYQWWLKVGYIPIQTQAKIEAITNGELVASVKDAVSQAKQEVKNDG